MRLINASTLQLEEFLGSNIPAYAILSHTWGPQEISLQDFTACLADSRLPLRQTAGFQKIVKACQQAAKEELQYCWIDTCCIDKSSSAELTEAINSMYEWYAKAQVCLVYLEDFVYDPENARREDIKIGGCRWFTRGWCLQELIAPKNLLFFDSAWNFAAEKRQLIEPLSSFTGIDKGVLRGYRRLSVVPVAVRLSWAAESLTTRLEDQAYCLLGILEINMPMLYGEGSKAFQRLQQEVLKVHYDESIFAWKTNSLTPYQEMLAPSVDCFKGCGYFQRLPELETRDRTFSQTSRGIRVTSPNLGLEVPPISRLSPKLRAYVMVLEGVMAVEHNPLHEDDHIVHRTVITLVKVKPGMYVRLNEARYNWSKWYSPECEMDPLGSDDDIYIIPTKDLPGLEPDPAWHAVQVECQGSIYGFNTTCRLAPSVEPRDMWDSANTRFFIDASSSPGFITFWAKSDGKNEQFILAMRPSREVSYHDFYGLRVDYDVQWYLVPPEAWKTRELITANGVRRVYDVAMTEESGSVPIERNYYYNYASVQKHKIGPLSITAMCGWDKNIVLHC